MTKFGNLPLRGSRLTVLRHLEGLTQGDLAHRLGVSQGFISQIEKDAKSFPADLAATACSLFQLPDTFFAVPVDPTEAGIATFRKTSTATVRDEQHVTALYGEAARLFRIASTESGYHAVDFEAAVSDDEEDTAANLRSMLGLDPSEPIVNATRALERLGIAVIHELAEIAAPDRGHEGMSRPNLLTDRPLVATVGTQPPAVARMTLMHELGHLLYDRALVAPIRQRRSPEERRAFRLAGAMLIPAPVVKARITESLTLHGYLRIKADYGISVAAVIQRASELRVITPARARSLFIQMSSQGWRRNEPVDVAAEEARLLTQAVRHGITADTATIAHITGAREVDIERWTGLTRPRPSTAKVISILDRRPVSAHQ